MKTYDKNRELSGYLICLSRLYGVLNSGYNILLLTRFNVIMIMSSLRTSLFPWVSYNGILFMLFVTKQRGREGGKVMCIARAFLRKGPG